MSATDGAPTDIAAEAALLGCCLLARNAVATARAATIGPGCFHRPAHGLIWEAIGRVYDTGAAPDPLLVADALGADLARAGGAPYLHHLIEVTPTATNVGWYADKVLRSYRQRLRWELLLNLRQLDDPAEFDARLAEHLAVARYDIEDRPGPWAPLDMEPILAAIAAGEVVQTLPTLGLRRDGLGLLYPGAVHSIAGEPGTGKSWFAQIILAAELTAGWPSLYVDFEDRAETLVPRLIDLGVPPEAIARHLRYVRPDIGLTAATWGQLAAAADGCRVATIDGVTEAMTLHGLALTDNEDVAKWLALLPRRLADEGPAVLQIDHVTKNTEGRGRWALGGGHKLAGISGAAYTLVAVEALARGRKGKAKVVIAKDRHGGVGPVGHTAADLILDATQAGRLYGWLDVPAPEETAEGGFRPTHLMERISEWLEDNPQATGRQVMTAVRGNTDAKRAALDVLISEGWVMAEDGARGARLHTVLRPYREDADARERM